ncbi:MAG TPA: phosphoenolpyruvate--protein phosphotransferase [Negativicutes bacterium]|nr:phosphoenolpyruvate--protein phosphotransferase [Negativicutes bacterium]
MANYAGVLAGFGVSAGIAGGRALVLKKDREVERQNIAEDEIKTQLLRLDRGIAQLTEETEKLLAQARAAMSGGEAEIFEAHVLMLQDPALREALIDAVTNKRKNLAWAVHDVLGDFIKTFAALDDEYMRQRAADLTEIRQRLLDLLDGGTSFPVLQPGSIIIAEDLGPAETLSLNRDCLAGIVLERGGRTSHTSVLARALGIPAVIGVDGITTAVTTGAEIIVDANAGQVHISPPDTVRAQYAAQISRQEAEKRALEELLAEPAVTLDGRNVALWANVGGVAEAAEALTHGAQGIGLFRTEFLYMDRQSLPCEEEQERVYREMLAVMRGKPVVIRTLDIGSDKKLPYVSTAAEDNPALGCRAIRWCLQEKEVFRTQLRALLKASVAGDLWIMFPMIAVPEELRAAKNLLADIRQQLVAEGTGVSERIKVGMMVEVPAAALNADLFAPEVDFFSIGTNDLLQYLFAADRQNEAVGYLYQPRNTVLLRLLRHIAAAAHRQGIPVGICGEMAGDPEMTAVLVGLGLDELSMSGQCIPRVKRTIRSLEANTAVRLLDGLMGKNNW